MMGLFRTIWTGPVIYEEDGEQTRALVFASLDSVPVAFAVFNRLPRRILKNEAFWVAATGVVVQIPASGEAAVFAGWHQHHPISSIDSAA